MAFLLRGDAPKIPPPVVGHASTKADDGILGTFFRVYLFRDDTQKGTVLR